jgi:hypothetical protein
MAAIPLRGVAAIFSLPGKKYARQRPGWQERADIRLKIS